MNGVEQVRKVGSGVFSILKLPQRHLRLLLLLDSSLYLEGIIGYLIATETHSLGVPHCPRHDELMRKGAYRKQDP